MTKRELVISKSVSNQGTTTWFRAYNDGKIQLGLLMFSGNVINANLTLDNLIAIRDAMDAAIKEIKGKAI